jgi:RING-H2 zinc finger protein RHA1
MYIDPTPLLPSPPATLKEKKKGKKTKNEKKASHMGFPSVCYCVILPQPLILVLHVLDLLRHGALLCLSSLGLASPPPADDHHPAYAAPPDLWAPEAAAAVKALLPAVRYGGAPAVCAVCLGALEPRHRVRELGNCAHAFHRACIDNWVDKGQATCPLCRAALMPAAAAADLRLAPSSSSYY